jgi:hypothetical protein
LVAASAGSVTVPLMSTLAPASAALNTLSSVTGSMVSVPVGAVVSTV